MELKRRLVIVLAHTISCVALHRRRYGLRKWPLAISVAGEERLARGASQNNGKPFFQFHRVYFGIIFLLILNACSLRPDPLVRDFVISKKEEKKEPEIVHSP